MAFKKELRNCTYTTLYIRLCNVNGEIKAVKKAIKVIAIVRPNDHENFRIMAVRLIELTEKAAKLEQAIRLKFLPFLKIAKNM